MSRILTEEHEAFRRTVRAFVEREITPHVEAWEEARSFPRELYRKAAQVGLLGLGFPEAYGGVEVDRLRASVLSMVAELDGVGILPKPPHIFVRAKAWRRREQYRFQTTDRGFVGWWQAWAR